ncbi:hypothetical protein YC2023_030318 [Brassica napus]
MEAPSAPSPPVLVSGRGGFCSSAFVGSVLREVKVSSTLRRRFVAPELSIGSMMLSEARTKREREEVVLMEALRFVRAPGLRWCISGDFSRW